MPPQKRRRAAAASASAANSPAVVLSGGHAQPPRTIDKFRAGKLCDVTLQAADGAATFDAHALCLTAASGYFADRLGRSRSVRYVGDTTVRARGVLALTR